MMLWVMGVQGWEKGIWTKGEVLKKMETVGSFRLGRRFLGMGVRGRMLGPFLI